MRGELRILHDARAVAYEGFEEVVRASWRAIDARGVFRIALSGGSTPRLLYETLAREGAEQAVEFENWHVYFGDERRVPPDHPDSNYGMARETLLEHVPIPPAQVHRMRGEAASAADAAAEYAAILTESFALAPGERPRFDLVLLGMGPDAHTASLFPGTDAVRETEELVVANWVPKLDAHRITLTPPTINAAQRIVFLVCGPDKGEPLMEVIEGEPTPERLPAQAIRPSQGGSLVWLVDRAAAAWLT